MDEDSLYLELEEAVDADSRERRAEPLKFVCEVLEPLRDSELETLLKMFRIKATHYRWYADDALFCLQRVLAAPPANLRESIRQGTGFVLNHVTPTEITPYSQADMVAWLRDIYDKLRVIYDETAPPK